MKRKRLIIVQFVGFIFACCGQIAYLTTRNSANNAQQPMVIGSHSRTAMPLYLVLRGG